MSKRKMLAEENVWKTKQARMIADLYKVFFDVMETNNLHGHLNVDTKSDCSHPTIDIVLFGRDGIDTTVVYMRTITRSENELYTPWVNRILALKKNLETFGKNFDIDDVETY